MFAPLMILGVLAAGPLKIRVEVVDYSVSSKGVPGAVVTLRETGLDAGAPAELRGTTDPTGLAWFEVPHLGFEPVEVEKDGYVTRAEMRPFQKEVGLTETKQVRGGEAVYWHVIVFARSQWKYAM